LSVKSRNSPIASETGKRLAPLSVDIEARVRARQFSRQLTAAFTRLVARSPAASVAKDARTASYGWRISYPTNKETAK
jgi:hypothetical protein